LVHARQAVIGINAVIATPTAIAESAPYNNCTAAHNDGRYDIQKGDSGYVYSQDRDGDGVACEC
jgi:hypothetical protein